MLLQFGFLRHERVLGFFERLNIIHAVGKAVIDPVNFGFDSGKAGFKPINLRLLLL